MLPFDMMLNAFATLFVTIDPIGLAPIFLAVTSEATKQERIQIGIRSVVVAAGILLTFALVGQVILSVLGISLPAFRIAGGILLFVIAFEMVFEKRKERKSKSAERVMSDDEMHNIAVFPLAIPLISGPGAISAVLLLSSQTSNWVEMGSVLFVVAFVLSLVLFTFVVSGWVEKMLGDNGRNILTRLLGVLLAALSVQFIADGVKALIVG
ncbi:multiple antibiotic resistance protein [Cohaesibacter sp. ES.047]|uniref:MarC family protein n=1 Tax=Cohaesibacter sp. ES.047 TaxID=1798205 RepID=UPI000BB8F0F6|nr:MarC family protein [Cohaesibacter sp. ES.047]SNY93307.1 multiple antibiotic resistance protein [Cohaesibacter sp. ES.047]